MFHGALFVLIKPLGRSSFGVDRGPHNERLVQNVRSKRELCAWRSHQKKGLPLRAHAPCCSLTTLCYSETYAMFSSACPSQTIALFVLLISTSFYLDVAPVQALGVNCRGSLLCPSPRLSPDYLNTIARIANGTISCNPKYGFNCGPMNDTDIYAPGKHIICLPQENLLGGVCAFTQGNVGPIGTQGDLIKRKLSELRAHGCTTCGSIPLSDDNNPDTMGILTVNYVSGRFAQLAPVDEAICRGLCPPTHYWSQVPINQTFSLNASSNRLVLPSVSNSVETS